MLKIQTSDWLFMIVGGKICAHMQVHARMNDPICSQAVLQMLGCILSDYRISSKNGMDKYLIKNLHTKHKYIKGFMKRLSSRQYTLEINI